MTLAALRESFFGLDGGAMFGIVPRPIWEKSNPADIRNRIDLACRCLYVEKGSQKILIDVGIGSHWNDKEREIYKISKRDDELTQSLKALGTSPEAITDVVLTHMHFDHAGGVSRPDESGRPIPAFPNARHWLQKRNWSWANGPSARDAGSYRSIDLEIFENGSVELRLIDGPQEIMEGVEVIPCHGHTFGMQLVVVEHQGSTFVHLADLIPTASHLRDPYVMGYDLQPLVTVEEKRRLLHHAIKEDWFLFFGHDPKIALARVERDGHGRPALLDLTRHEEGEFLCRIKEI